MTMRQSAAGGAAEHALDRRGEIAAARLDPNRAAAAEQRHRVGLLDQPLRLVGERIAFDAGEREGVAGIVDRAGDECVDALAHEAGIGSVYQDDRAGRIRSRDESVDVGVLDRHHRAAAQVPATKNEASRALMLSAICCAARSSASRKPRSRAKRWAWPGMS